MGSRRPSAPVLIVEDNYETREVLERILELWGYATATAEDGLAALGYLRGGNPACLIILDLRMPIMDGWALSRELQGDPKFAQIPVVAFSANIEVDFPGAAEGVTDHGVPERTLVLGLRCLAHLRETLLNELAVRRIAGMLTQQFFLDVCQAVQEFPRSGGWRGRLGIS